MTTEKHTTVVEVDLSRAIPAWDRHEAAIDASGGAAQRLAAGMASVERASVETAQAVDLITAALKNNIAALKLEWSAAEANHRRALTQATQQEAAQRKTIELVKREGIEREQAWRAAEDNARKTHEMLKRAHAEAVETSAAMSTFGGGGGGLLSVASKLGNVASGIQAVVSGLREAATVIDDMAEESFAVQGTARNLQLDLTSARAEAGGLVSDYALAIAANKAYAMGVATTGDEFGHIVGMVRQQATKLGKDQTQLIGDYVEAVGKQEAEIFDNLGMTLRLTDAYEIYAEQIGVAANELTKSQKADAFKVAAMHELEEATGQATVEVEGNVRAWKELKTEYENVRKAMFGFDDVQGRVNEALRELSDEQIGRLKFAEMADDSSSVGKEALAMLDKWNVSLVELRGAADTMGVDYQVMLENAIKAHARLADEAEAERIEAERLAEVRDLTEQADSLDHMIDLLEVEGLKEKEKIQYQIDSLEVRRQAAIIQAELTKATKDEAEILAIERKIELLEAGKTAKKKGGKRKDPNKQLDMETAATLRLIDARATLYGLDNERARDLDELAAQQAWLLELEREALDVREQAANDRKVKGAAEQDKLESEQLAIMTERRVIDHEMSMLARDEERRRSEESLAARDREIEFVRAQGAAVQILEGQRRVAHEEHVRQFGEAQELLDVENANAIRAIEADREERVAAREDDLQAFEREAELSAARGLMIGDEADQRMQLQLAIASAEGDQDAIRQLHHEREVARIKERYDVQKRITSASNSLLTAGSSLFAAVAGAAIKDEEKREKAMLRARGVEAVARGALSTVEAVAAFASFNYVQGIMHVAAAATAFATGIPMLAGKVPSKGGAAASGGGGGGSQGPHKVVVQDGLGDSARDRPSTPASAEELTKLRGGFTDKVANGPSSGGGNTYIDNRGSNNVANDTGQLFSDLSGRQQKKAWG